ncbi:MAG TPA: lipopolysaccharide kinase InaA family protein, partial [Planctomycetaceae bacterium]|nr:lipopolysaccharide kinase InaA family protein [Planctomycetaceae bacterium]
MSGTASCRPAPSALSRTAPPEAVWQTVRAGESEWLIRAELAAEFLDADGLRWNEWQRRGMTEVVKTGPHRTVSRLSLPGGEFYVKHFRIADYEALLRNLVRAAPAQRELTAVQRISALRLATFEPVAVGCARQFGVTSDSYLISRAVPDAVPLDHFLLTDFAGRSGGVQAELRQRLARELGRLAARLHAAGIEHVDLHAGNLLIRTAASLREPLLALIDLHAVRFRRSLSAAQRDRNLTALHQFFAGRSTRADRRRFWLAYYEGLRQFSRVSPKIKADAPPRDSEPFRLPTGSAALSLIRRPPTRHAREAGRLEVLLNQAAQAGWRRADRAWRRGNRHVRRFEVKKSTCRGLATLHIEWLTEICQSPETLFERYAIRWCKQSPRHRVAEVAVAAHDSGSPAMTIPAGTTRTDRTADVPVTPSPRLSIAAEERGAQRESVHAYWKCITEQGWKTFLLAGLRFSPVRRAWETGHALLRRGIDTPKPLLYVEQAESGVRRGYLLTAAVENSTTAQEFFHTQWPPLEGVGQSAWLARHARKLAQQLRGLHDAGFDHRDLKFPNLLVANDP